MANKCLSLSSNSSQDSSNALYEAALKSDSSWLRNAVYFGWIVVGLTGLIALAWAEPFSGWLFDWAVGNGLPSWLVTFVALPLVMALRAILLVESFGYLYHRFFQHVGFFTRRAQVFRRNQKFHWIHHMVIYPIGRFYRRARPYVTAEKGVGWSWVLPGIAVCALFVAYHGVNPGTVVFVLALGWWAKFIVDRAHSRFHVVDHPWAKSPYFHWLEDIHVLHHWDQRTNFTIVHPLMDILFGTYLSPATHGEELRVALADEDLTVSDLINWRYLLIEATPIERAAFISGVKTNRKSLKKVKHLFRVLEDRLALHPADAEAALLKERATELLRAIDSN